MTASRCDIARGQAGDVGKANGYQRHHSSITDLFPESLPESVAAHRSHISTASEAQRKRIVVLRAANQAQAVESITHHLTMAFAEADGPVWATAAGLASVLVPVLKAGVSALPKGGE